MPKTARGARRTYHHGDLRKALIEAAIALIDESGVEALTLRAVAARAGVSHAAPQHHFPALVDLLTAVATVAFERLTETLDEACAEAARPPEAQLRAHGRGYLAFARRHPGLFRLMFTSTRLDWRSEALHAAARATYARLEDVTRPIADTLGVTTAAGRTRLEQIVWSSAHGFAHLVIEGMIPKRGQPVPVEVPDIAALLLGAQRLPRTVSRRSRPGAE